MPLAKLHVPRAARILALALCVALSLGAAPSLGRPATPHHADPTPPRDGSKAPAFTVAVFGDGFGEALEDGLREGLGSDAGFTILSATHAPSGLAARKFDWTATARSLLAGRTIGAAVIMLGANDIEPLPDGTATADPGTPRWTAIYGDRVAAVVDQFRAAKVPLIWVGLPIVADEQTAAGYATLNEAVRDRATKAGATYVDSWNAFADEGGRYDADGPDKDGRPARLRTADGRDFTRAGAIKLASFVEGELRRDKAVAMATMAAATDVVLPSAPELDNDVNAQIRRELGLPPLPGAAPTAAERGPALLLSSPPLSPDGQLVAAGVAPATVKGTGGGSLAERALIEGLPLPPRRGRIDDFTWPRP